MKRFLVVLAACGPSSTPEPRTVTSPAPMPRATPAVVTMPQPPPEPSTQMINGALCAIKETNVTLARPLRVALHGKPFAEARELTSLDVRAAAVGASARVETNDFVLVGDIDLKKQPI